MKLIETLRVRARAVWGRLPDLDRGGWLAASVVLVVAAAVSPWSLPNWLGLTTYAAVWILAGFAGVSATLIGLLYAAAIFRGQHLGARLPSELVGELFESRWQRGAFFRLVAVLTSSVLALASISEPVLPAGAVNAVDVNLIVLLFTLLGARVGIARVFDRRYPLAVMSRLMRRVDDAYLARLGTGGMRISSALASGVTSDETDAFALIEQTCLRAVRDGDLTTAHLVLRGLTGRVVAYLKTGPHNARAVLGWVGELFSLVGRRAVIAEERTAQLVLILISETLHEVLTLKLPWPERVEFLESFRQLRHGAIQANRPEVVNDALHDLGHLFKKSLQNAPQESLLSWSGVDPPDGWKHNPTLENEWHHLEQEWLGAIRNDLDLLIQRDMRDPFGMALFVMGYMAHDVLESPNLGDRQKRWLLLNLMWASRHAVSSAILAGRSEDYVRWDLQMDDVLDEKGFADLVVASLNEQSELLVEASRAGVLPWIVLNSFAAEGRGYASKAADERAMIVVETFGAMAEPLSKHQDPEMRNRYLEAVSGLRSIAEWDKRESSALKDAVAREVEKYGEEPERLQQWHESIPSRRRIPPGQLHNTPWA